MAISQNGRPRNGKADALDINPTSALLRTLFLARLQAGDNYPSGLARDLAAEGVPVDPAHASTLMAQLQAEGLAESQWVFDQGSRPRRWYTMTERGRQEVPSIVTKTVDLYRQVLTILQP